MIIGGIAIKPILERLYDLHVDFYMGDRCGWGSPWGTWYRGFDNSVSDVAPEGTSELRIRALMKVMGKMELVDGCHCGCRGDYEITIKGCELLESLESVK